jgi:hypothetical protein
MLWNKKKENEEVTKSSCDSEAERRIRSNQFLDTIHASLHEL